MLRRALAVTVAVGLVVGGASVAGAGGRPGGGSKVATRKVAGAALLTAADVGAGWVSSAPTDRLATGLKECRTIETAVKANRRLRQSSPEFARPPASRTQNTVYGFATVAAAKDFFRVFTRRGASPCFEAMVRSAVQDTQPDAVIAARVFDGTGFDTAGTADEVAGTEFTITVNAPTGPVVAYVTAVAARADRFFAGFTFQSTGTPLPEAGALVVVSLTRLRAALAAA